MTPSVVRERTRRVRRFPYKRHQGPSTRNTASAGATPPSQRYSFNRQCRPAPHDTPAADRGKGMNIAPCRPSTQISNNMGMRASTKRRQLTRNPHGWCEPRRGGWAASLGRRHSQRLRPISHAVPGKSKIGVGTPTNAKGR